MKNKKIAILGGAGKMGMSLIRGLLAVGEVNNESIIATAKRRRSLALLEENNIKSTRNNAEAIAKADVIVLAVHPGDAKEVLCEIAPSISKEQVLLSIVTGVTSAQIEKMLPKKIPVVRAMPNIAAVVGQSITVICRGLEVTDAHMDMANSLFATIGLVEELDEDHMDASTGLGGCGPAFVFKIIEAMSEGGVKRGLPRDVSRKMAAQVVKGAAAMVLETGMHPAELKDEVTTPGGCTIDGIAKLQERGIAIALIDAVDVSSRKAGRLWDETS